MTNKEILDQAIATIIKRGDTTDYPMERHLNDLDLVANLTALKIKFRKG